MRRWDGKARRCEFKVRRRRSGNPILKIPPSQIISSLTCTNYMFKKINLEGTDMWPLHNLSHVKSTTYSF